MPTFFSKITCFSHSDEDESVDQDGLMYLPISLEMDEVENIESGAYNSGVKNESSSSVKTPRKAKAVDVDLRDAPREGLYRKFILTYDLAQVFTSINIRSI